MTEPDEITGSVYCIFRIDFAQPTWSVSQPPIWSQPIPGTSHRVSAYLCRDTTNIATPRQSEPIIGADQIYDLIIENDPEAAPSLAEEPVYDKILQEVIDVVAAVAVKTEIDLVLLDLGNGQLYPLYPTDSYIRRDLGVN